MRRMISEILEENGMEIVGEADTGAAAIKLYRELTPDLVTMDIIMPEMNGIDAVKEIIEMDSQARIVMCSALGQQALVQEAISAGAKDFLIKPFNPSRVVEVVNKVLNRNISV
ncbi:MAG: two-component system response regulator [Candidatus Latescibacteria bacterium 4484_7]|nr:MAG: two-component system response regulator [Candidatus Latescibacteria bacterium 4484_7]